tara:strand:+ start:3236 stop:3505 length:270 start_codon:yes stop_codon:yes gene_type:complete
MRVVTALVGPVFPAVPGRVTAQSVILSAKLTPCGNAYVMEEDAGAINTISGTVVPGVVLDVSVVCSFTYVAAEFAVLLISTDRITEAPV